MDLLEMERRSFMNRGKFIAKLNFVLTVQLSARRLPLQFPELTFHCRGSGSTYHRSFNPNWTWRELVAVDVITPAVGEGSPVAAAYTTGFGVLRFA